jgi:arylsulfatase A-like enzyme
LKKVNSASSTQLSYVSFLFGCILALVLLAIPLLFRIPFITANGMPFVKSDLSGFIRDIVIISAILAALIKLKMTWSHYILILCLGIFLLIEAANASHIWVFGTSIDVAQAHYLLDPTFLFGSAMKIQNPGALSIGVFLLLLITFLSLRISARARLTWPLTYILAGSLMLPFLSENRDLAPWRITGVLTQNFSSIVRALEPDKRLLTSPNEHMEMFEAFDQELEGDLSGVFWAKRPVTDPNILVIMLESVSTAYLPIVAGTQNLSSRIEMPHLDKFAREGLVLSRFFTHQRQTTRGTYSLLCGKLPRFSTGRPKLEIAADTGQKLNCLPNRLADLGYRTEYFQAAPLSFSQKDRALPLIGYQHLKGAAAFSKSEIGSAWGPNDQVFFEKAFSEIERLSKQSQPWFLTLLNVGTHHPFDIVPDSFPERESAKTRAFEHLDFAFGKFTAALRSNQLLENTIVIVVSDEAGGLEGISGYALGELSRNWGVLAVVAPKLLSSKISDTNTGQFDLPISILDLLGIPKFNEFQGRSIFRNYSEERTVYAYNNNSNVVYAIRKDEVNMCHNDGVRCQKFKMDSNLLGFMKPRSEHTEQRDQATAQNIVLYTNQEVDDKIRHLLPDGSQVLVTEEDPYLICCQYFQVSDNETFTFKAEIILLSDEPVLVHADVVSQSAGQFTTHFAQDILFEPNVAISIGAVVDDDLDGVEVRFLLAKDHEEANFEVISSSVLIE